jgi:hypothetical protein
MADEQQEQSIVMSPEAEQFSDFVDEQTGKKVDAFDGVDKHQQQPAQNDAPLPEQQLPPAVYVPQDDLPPFEGETVEEYTDYLLQQSDRRYELRQMNDRVESTERAARRAHDGRDGLPTYDDICDGYVAPWIRQKPEMFKWLREQNNPAESAFFVGLVLKYPHLHDLLKREGQDAFIRAIKRGDRGTQVRPGRYKPGKLTKQQIEAMGNSDFEQLLDDFKLYGEQES